MFAHSLCALSLLGIPSGDTASSTTTKRSMPTPSRLPRSRPRLRYPQVRSQGHQVHARCRPSDLQIRPDPVVGAMERFKALWDALKSVLLNTLANSMGIWILTSTWRGAAVRIAHQSGSLALGDWLTEFWGLTFGLAADQVADPSQDPSPDPARGQYPPSWRELQSRSLATTFHQSLSPVRTLYNGSLRRLAAPANQQTIKGASCRLVNDFDNLEDMLPGRQGSGAYGLTRLTPTLASQFAPPTS